MPRYLLQSVISGYKGKRSRISVLKCVPSALELKMIQLPKQLRKPLDIWWRKPYFHLPETRRLQRFLRKRKNNILVVPALNLLKQTIENAPKTNSIRQLRKKFHWLKLITYRHHENLVLRMPQIQASSDSRSLHKRLQRWTSHLRWKSV